ncbi:MAG TPA: xylose isomerase [Spirochaetes bacterium]|nr:xylose isomerase [Spirochaetota bacterium]
MKLSLSTFVYFRYPLIEAIQRTAGHGYDGVEIWGGRPHAYCDDMDPRRVADTAAVIADSGIAISNFIPAQFRYPVNIAAADDRIRAGSVDYLRKSIDAAAALGSPSVSLCPGFSLYGQSHGDAWDRMTESLQKLLDHARNMPLALLLEPGNLMETDLVVTVNDGIRAVKQLEGVMGLLPDTGYLYINRESLSDVVDRCGDIPCHYHIDDNMGASDDHMTPGEGKIDFDIFLGSLAGSGYDGFLAVELGFQYTADPDPAVKRSIEFLKHKV